ncbi:hypothetical protein O3M35_005643 [Rhynocoris fuscipes]|uniref:Peroxisomal ATPase PEX6 n=1 Tax=Rhynocoris fuscipes TaxID=488301 RepID=A0AAW1DIW6_9HEMI
MCGEECINYLHLCYFIESLVRSKKNYELNILGLWLSQMKVLVTEYYFTILYFQNSILKVLLPDLIKVNYINEILFVNFNNLCRSHNKWCLFEFKHQSRTFKRILKVIPSSQIPKGYILCSNDTYFMIKHSFNYTSFIPNASIKFKILEILDEYNHQHANKLITFILHKPLHMPSVLFDKTIVNFISTPKLMHTGDVISIDLSLYGVEKVFDYICFKVVKLLGPVNEFVANDLEHSLIVSQKTKVYGETFIPHYLPSLEWFLLDYRKLNTVTPILPLGLEKYYFDLLKWIRPFLVSKMDGLKPIFIISGLPGSGKSILIEAACKKLGLHYCDIDCNSIISNTLTQINANIKSTLTTAASRSPCILHLKNYHMMSSESDGLDSIQLCESLRNHIDNFTSSYPVIIIASCDDIEMLKGEFVRISLDQMHISLPTEKERTLMISWLTRVHNLVLDRKTKEFVVSETKSCNFDRIKNILCLAEKERIISGDHNLDISHFSTVLGRLTSMERLSATVEWADVGGVELIKKEVVSSLVSSRLLSSRTSSNGARRTGILLHGPPGTGKTLLARAVASQSMRAFVPVNGPDLLNMYVGQSEANVRAVFSRAREAAPCIMFFDELDSIAPNRGNKSDSGGVMDRVVSTLLSEMDSLDSSGDVFILGATNRPDLLDPALLRPGRFDKMLYIGPCQDEDSKLKVLKALSRKFLLKDVHLEDIVKLLPDEVTGATMYGICSTAWLSAARQLIRTGNVKPEAQVTVQMEHFEQAIRQITKS